jgi:hypothetical protein
MFGIYFSASGAGHFISVCLDPSKSLIVSVVFVALMSALSGVQPSLSDLERAFGGFLGSAFPAISFIRWGAQGFYTHILKTYRDIYEVSYALEHQSYSFNCLAWATLCPFVIGLVFRAGTALALLFRARKLKWA